MADCPGKTPLTKNAGRASSPKGETPIAKNVMVLDAHLNPLHPTYPRRARHLVKRGRAEWVDDTTIRMLSDPPQEERAKAMPENEATAREEWVEYLKGLADKLTANDGVAMAAIEAIRSLAGSPSLGDKPSMAVGKIVEASQKARGDVLRSLTEFLHRQVALGKLLERIEAQPIDPVVKANMLKEIAEAVARGKEYDAPKSGAGSGET